MSSFYGGGGGGSLSKKDLDAITSKIFKFKVVTSLPTEEISDSTIYLINTGEEENNFYTEYVYIDNNWEKFGTQKVDLSNYVISQDLALALETKADKEDIPDVSSFITADVDNLTNYYRKDTIDNAFNLKVDKDGNKVLTDINYSVAEQAKVTAAYEARHTHDNKAVLDGITEAKVQAWDAAQVNVNADWNAYSGDARILNKPDLSVYARKDDMTAALGGKVDKETGRSLMSADEHTKLNGIETGAQVNTVTGVKGNAESDYRTGEINISPANIGLGNVDNTSDANKPISTAAQAALDGKQNILIFDNAPTENSEKPVKSGGVYSALAGKISTSAKGANGGVAELDANGKIPSSQMPSSVDNILEYPTLNDFPATGEDRKIYIALDTKLTYRWGGTEYGEISPSIALGTTSSTAYRGDWGAEDRAAIGTLTDLQTTAKSNLVSAVNEVKTALGNVQGTLTFDNVPTSGSGNPVKSGGIYTALAGKQDALTIDSAPTSGSDNPVKSGGVYTALSGKQNTLTFDNVPTENSNNPVKSGGIYNALSEKADATAIQTALNAKQNALTAGTNLSMSEATINHTASGVTAGTYGASTKVPQISLDAQGHITQISEKTVMAVADLTVFSPNCFCRTDVNLGAVNINNIDDFISSYGIASGNYSADICVGAYFTSSYDGVDTVFRVAGFDLYLWSGTERNHIIVLPDYQLTTAAMNSSNTTSGGYYGSAMFKTVLGGNSTASGINNKLYNIFGNHLLAYTDLLSTNVDTNATSKANPITKGAVCDWTGTSVYANLLSGTHLWGENISGSGICDYGVPVGQFPLFRFEPKYIINRNTSGNKNRYWLRNIYVTNIFAACNDNGTVAGKSMDSTVGVRPFFLLG